MSADREPSGALAARARKIPRGWVYESRATTDRMTRYLLPQFAGPGKSTTTAVFRVIHP